MAELSPRSNTECRLPPEVVVVIREVRASLAGCEGALDSALGVGSNWEWRGVAEAADLIARALLELPEVPDA